MLRFSIVRIKSVFLINVIILDQISKYCLIKATSKSRTNTRVYVSVTHSGFGTTEINFIIGKLTRTRRHVKRFVLQQNLILLFQK